MIRMGRRVAARLTGVVALVLVGYWVHELMNDLGPHRPVTPTAQPLPFPHPATDQSLSPSLRSQILLNLQAVVVQLQRTSNINEEWSTDIEEQLVSILQQLDPMYEPSPRLNEAQFSAIKSGTTFLDFCPEHFVRSDLAKPYYLSGSWLLLKACPKVRPLEELVSIIIDWNETSIKCDRRLKHLLDAIEQTHPLMSVFVAMDFTVCEWTTNLDENSVVKVFNVNNTARPGLIWNKLASKVKTPYVLVGRDLEDFSWLTHIRRQISVLSTDPLVHVVSGSVRNISGHWQVGCYQSYLYNYILEYRDGYFTSKYECMFCDHVLGPFVVRARTLQTLRFDERLSSSTLFEDWFLRLKEASQLVMNCPDALYFSTDPTFNDKLVKRDPWLSLARKWQINRLVIPDGIKMSFSCAESGITCFNMYELTKKQTMPICCMDQLANAMQVFHQLCVSHGLLYSYIGGTALGAVKLRGFIPWDFDGDAEYYVADLSFFRDWGKKQQKRGKGVFIDGIHMKHPGYFRLRTPEMFVEMFAVKRTASDQVMPHVFKKIPTKMRIHGVWVYGPPSPGLYARNVYGKEALQHASNWLHMRKKWWTVPYSVKRHFLPCENYGHHACTSQFNTDGSFQFTIP